MSTYKLLVKDLKDNTHKFIFIEDVRCIEIFDKDKILISLHDESSIQTKDYIKVIQAS